MRAREHIHVPNDMGEKVADGVANAIGSWRFIIAQAALMTVWIIINTLALFHFIRFDSYPFVFLNLAMSAEAAFSAPIIMQSQNRQSNRDRKRDDLESVEVEQLLQINQRQLEILQLLHEREQSK